MNYIDRINDNLPDIIKSIQESGSLIEEVNKNSGYVNNIINNNETTDLERIHRVNIQKGLTEILKITEETQLKINLIIGADAN